MTELSAILDNSQHHFNYAFADAALYTIASSKDQKFFKMSLFNSKFEIATGFGLILITGCQNITFV
jgi:hypothetical protein